MSENKGLPPDLDARILAEAVMGTSAAALVFAISPKGTPEDHLTILRRIDALLVSGALVSARCPAFGSTAWYGEYLVASVERLEGGVA